ncbi:PSP1 C-terminal conserved region-domain-containing protein, partial [Mortierella sp. GBAus27b]
LYVVEFKAGRTDLFYVAENSGVSLKVGDLVIVEADRGKDLGKITNDSITPQQIQAMQAQQAEIAALQAQQDGGTNSGGNASGGNAGGGHRAPKEIHPKRIFRLAQPSEVAQLVSKNQDELKAMMICQTKVRQKRLPMEVVDAEYQWDRRKLTFYFIAERRIDFRELVRDLFKIYKTRIWMYAVSPSTVQSNAARLQSSPPQPPQPLHQPGPSGTAILTSPTSPRSHSEYQSAALSGFHLQYSPQHGQYAHYSHYHHVSVPLQHHQQTQQLMPAHLSSSHSFHPLSPLSPLSPPIQQQQQQQQQHHHLHQQLQQQQQNSYPYSSINS